MDILAVLLIVIGAIGLLIVLTAIFEAIRR